MDVELKLPLSGTTLEQLRARSSQRVLPKPVDTVLYGKPAVVHEISAEAVMNVAFPR
mgnify:CR=1 FL=1